MKEVLAGRAYSLGDYRGTTGVAPDWAVTGVADAFARTSQVLATQYPELRAPPTERGAPCHVRQVFCFG